MKSKKTQKALSGSILALVLCFVMLIGTTFAWFTSSDSTAVNTIQAGTLKVELQDEEGHDLTTAGLAWQKAANHENEPVLWEPGVTYKTRTFRIVNKGNLALKYKIELGGITGDKALLDVIDFKVVDGDGHKVSLDSFESHLSAGTEETPSYHSYYIEATMDTKAGNEYQGKKLESIAIAVVAGQYTEEYDSSTNRYDADAVYSLYPAGVTLADFTDGKVAVDSKGTFYTTFTDALAAGGTLYLKEDSVVPSYNSHPNVTEDITIYANGATFNNDISIGTYATPESDTVNVTIYNAKNLTVWGEPKGNGTTWNVTMIGCENDGYGLVMYRADSGNEKLNLTVCDCKANGYNDSIIHATTGGTIEIENCVFTNNCAPINIAHKFDEAMTVTVKDCEFINCGKVNPDNDYFAPARFVNNNTGSALTVVMENNRFSGTVGTNGDVLIGDHRTGKTNGSVTLTISGTQQIGLKIGSNAIQTITDYAQDTVNP